MLKPNNLEPPTDPEVTLQVALIMRVNGVVVERHVSPETDLDWNNQEMEFRLSRHGISTLLEMRNEMEGAVVDMVDLLLDNVEPMIESRCAAVKKIMDDDLAGEMFGEDDEPEADPFNFRGESLVRFDELEPLYSRDEPNPNEYTIV